MTRRPADFARLLVALSGGGVDFVLVGGLAAIAHGAARATYDVDLVYSRDEDNLERLARALAPASPYLRDAPPGLPFLWDATTLRQGMNFTLTTAWGDVDLFGDLPGGGGWSELAPCTIPVPLFGKTVRCLDLATLLRIKRAAGRPRDLEDVATLERLRDRARG